VNLLLTGRFRAQTMVKMQRRDIVVVVPEETIQRWQWPAMISCGAVALVIIFLLAFLFLRKRSA
jgi:hypothetical protein